MLYPQKENQFWGQLIETWKDGGDPSNLDCAEVADPNAEGKLLEENLNILFQMECFYQTDRIVGLLYLSIFSKRFNKVKMKILFIAWEHQLLPL